MSSLQMIVKQHQAKAAQLATESVDWEKRKEKWLAALRQLIDHLRQSFIDAGVPTEKIVETQNRITEETLGSYDAPGLEVTIGRDLVTFVPMASVIIGGYGRVDVTGPRSEVKLIADVSSGFSEAQSEASPYESDWVWSAYPAQSRRSGFPLDEEGLSKVLEVVLIGV